MNRHPLPGHLAHQIDGLFPHRQIVVAVSGGADSMALFRGLHELQDEYKLRLHVAHLDHELRGEASRGDAAWLEDACRKLCVPCTIGTSDVAATAKTAGLGIEETAREERYRFLEETALAVDCPTIAVAHTADDQTETILHHVLRGTGLAGLGGIPRTRQLGRGVSLVRPLLDLERTVIVDYLEKIGQGFRTDATNDDESYTRNRIRRQLLPLLTEQYNPNFGQALRRLGQQAAGMHAAFVAVAGELLERVLDSSKGRECRLKWQPLASVPRPLVRELFAELWRRQGWPRQSMGFDQWEELARIASDGGAGTFPGKIDVRREGRWVVLRRLDRDPENG
jgi:tRNA(Ile)-lysidine synthase